MVKRVRSTGQTSRLDLEGMVGFGENPNGATLYAPNGTARSQGAGWNRQRNYQWPEEKPEPGTPWSPSNNRTGE